MFEFLTWLESSALGQFIRQSSVWTYSLVNLFHVLGLSTLFGAVLILDLRLLGLWRKAPLAEIARVTVPLAKTGFGIAVLSGIGLLTANATEYYGNTLLYVKFPAIVLGMINVATLQRLPAWKARGARELSSGEQKQLAFAGGVSLCCWLTAVVAGRMIAYW
jgi:hypothetical protein